MTRLSTALAMIEADYWEAKWKGRTVVPRPQERPYLSATLRLVVLLVSAVAGGGLVVLDEHVDVADAHAYPTLPTLTRPSWVVSAIAGAAVRASIMVAVLAIAINLRIGTTSSCAGFHVTHPAREMGTLPSTQFAE